MKEKIEETLDSLNSNGFDTEYVENKAEAMKAIKEYIPEHSTVGVGDSTTIFQIGIIQDLLNRGTTVINPFTRAKFDYEKWRSIAEKALQTDFFIASSNAVTMDGKIVNRDATGNRVSGMIFGPNNVLLVVGRNKIVKDENEAISRIKNVIAPQHAKTQNVDVPCAETGECVDCDSERRICRVQSTIMRNPRQTNITVLIIDEDLGLGWDPSWSSERKNRIKNEYEENVWAPSF